ncbi:hypothetical protein ADN00_10195 [Ornatilinea apprima]|uniref:S-isoprenylcysteine methyltransferase n=1 Tax=Ornatilinea apprima TaxID=1134406 RepID=A0A0P6X9Q7_9CHLR|nr:isoprenylcysteine carboxylmethyltransferase family protein [Ornatilinea apprima]KPL76950.1 hypothetical protein ADN00_10195 [Ornatilinea apprima]
MKPSPVASRQLIFTVIKFYLLAAALLMLLFFLPAGTFQYWQAWVYMVVILGPMLLVMVYLLRNDPELLARRMQFRERAADQNLITRLSILPFLAAFILPGFDRRFGWSHVPVWLAVTGQLLVLSGYVINFLVFRENSYASRIVEVSEGQTVISSGPYAIVRHPMYLGVMLLYRLSPLALGSYWGMIPALMIIPFIIVRIISEEKLLVKELKGYAEYRQKVRYRLIPGIW